MKRLVLLLALQATMGPPGTVTSTPGSPAVGPTPSQLTATTGTVGCTLKGNTFPASAVTITCTVGGVAITPYTIPLTSGGSYIFSHNFGTDLVTVSIISSPSTGQISVQATANGSAPVTTNF